MRYNNKNYTLPTSDSRFRLEAFESSQISFVKISSAWTTFQYSTDGENWQNCTDATTISLNKGQKAYFRAKQTGNSSDTDYTKFSLTGKVAARGNIMYLYNYENPNNTTITYTNAFVRLFQECPSLISAPELPATTLSEHCYRLMFYECTQLTTAPILPATTLPQYCYRFMFEGCTLLNRIFTYAQTISNANALTSWLNNVSSTGLFYNLGGATYSSGASGIPEGWTEHTSI